MSILPRADVLLMTVSEAETRAVLDAMAALTGQPAQRVPRSDRTLYDLGAVAKTRVWLVRSEPGASTPGGAFATLSTALPEVRPLAILLVGTATGLDPASQGLGDVLVSHQLMAYEPQHLGSGPDGGPIEISRGDRVTASERALDRCRAAALGWTAAPVRLGLLLSGEKQIEHAPSAARLQAHAPEALGVEQEGVALYVVARQRKLDWLVVKAIAGWPDGTGAQEELAARSAAAFVAHLLGQGGFAPTGEQIEALALLEELPADRLPERAPPLPALSRIPFLPNPLFVGRTTELCTLARQLKDHQTVAITPGAAGAGRPAVVTTGMGGVGKTQLAIELAHRYGGYFAGGVFWLSFASPAGVAGEVAACGLGGLITRPDYPSLKQDEQVALVRAAWQEPIPRLLIFDNCEDEALLRTWLPATGGCWVLVTSRRPSWSSTLRVAPFRLEVLPRADSVRLLQRLAPHLSDEEADEIAEELGDLPLALHLAGCYLAFYDDVAPRSYLAKLRAVNPLTHWSLQGDGVEVMPTDREPHVARAFALSFERLAPAQPTDALAQALLARAACFAPGEPFARAWLAATVEPPGDEEEQGRARTRALKRLLGLGLLEQIDAERLRLHRLLAAYADLATSDVGALAAVERVVNRLAYQANESELPQTMRPVLPHLRYLVQRSDGREDDVTTALYNNLGSYFDGVGSYAEAQTLHERALAIRERVLGSEHPDTATSLNNLAGAYYAQGAYGWALPLYERALAIRERVLGAEHPDTARSLNNLAFLLRVQGAYGWALPLYERALAIRERVLGPEHPDTAQSLDNLAVLLEVQGAYERALPLYERALAIRERVLGSEHPDMAVSLSNLALLFQVQGAYGRALPLYERALAIRERVLGSEHPDTAQSLNNLAGLYHAQGAYEWALPLYERALAIRERVLGSEHPDTARSLNNLAYLYQAQGAHRRAMPLYERALAIQERVLGSEHPDTSRSLNNLAGLYYGQGAYEQALPLYERVMAIRERVLGSEHPDTARSLNNLASLYQAQGAYERALPLYERALAIQEQALGPEHPDTAQSLNNLAHLLQAQGAYGRALPLYERALAVRERVLSLEHPDTAQSLNNLASLYQAQGAYGWARPLYERALAVRERVLGPEHPDTAQSLNNLAHLLQAQGAYAEALPLCERALAIQEQALGPDHPDTATSLNNLASLHQAQGAYERALLLYERALAIQERVLGPEHPSTAMSLNNLAMLYAYQGQYALSLPLLERAFAIWQAQLGPQHPHTAQARQSLAELHRRMAVAALPESARAAVRARDQAAPQGKPEAHPPPAAQPQAPPAPAPRRPGSADAGALRRAAALAGAQAKVATVGPDPQARAELAARLRALADRHEHGDPADPELAAQLRALAEQLGG